MSTGKFIIDNPNLWPRMTDQQREEFLARDLEPPGATQPCWRCGHTHRTERADRKCYFRLSKFHWGKGMR